MPVGEHYLELLVTVLGDSGEHYLEVLGNRAKW